MKSKVCHIPSESSACLRSCSAVMRPSSQLSSSCASQFAAARDTYKPQNRRSGAFGGRRLCCCQLRSSGCRGRCLGRCGGAWPRGLARRHSRCLVVPSGRGWVDPPRKDHISEDAEHPGRCRRTPKPSGVQQIHELIAEAGPLADRARHMPGKQTCRGGSSGPLRSGAQRLTCD